MKPDCRLTKASKHALRGPGLRVTGRGLRLLRGHLGAPAIYRPLRPASGAVAAAPSQLWAAPSLPPAGEDVAQRLIRAERAGELDGLGWATDAALSVVLS